MEGRAGNSRAAIEMIGAGLWRQARSRRAPARRRDPRLNAAQLEAQLDWIEEALRRVEKGELP